MTKVKQGFALRFVMARPWALGGMELQAMGQIAARDLDNIDLMALGLPATQEAVAAYQGERTAAGVEMRGSVALIHVRGVVSRYASLFSAICGGTSTQMIAQQLAEAVDSPQVKSVVMVIDSPGGEANGIHELAEMIYNARASKKVIAYVSGTGASAAYWIASACSEIVLDDTAYVGSIGTVMQMKFRRDTEVETVEIVSSQSPNKRLDPRTDEGREAYQQDLDNLADVFINRVARNRGVSREVVLQDFAQGGCLMGQAAVDAKMADRLGSLESVIKELKGTSMTHSKTYQAVSLAASLTPAAAVSALSAARPDVVAALLAQGGGAQCQIPAVESMAAAEVVEAITAARPDVVAAIQAAGEAPVMAVDAAAEVVRAASSAGVPALAAELLGEGMTLEAAKARCTAAGELKDVLAAAGMADELGSLSAHLDNPSALAGAVIGVMNARTDEQNGIRAEVVTDDDKEQATAAALDPKAIYDRRNS